MTNPISGGLVSIEDGTKKSEEYAPARKVRVELRFDVEPNGTDGQDRLDVIAAIANAKVSELLGTAAVITEPIAAKLAEKVPDKTPATTTKTRAPAKSSAKAETVDSVAAAAKAGKLEEKPSTPSAQAATQPEPSTAASAPSAREYSDRELKAAMSAKHQETQDAVSIRNFVKQFRPADWTSEFTTDNIPQEKRQEFLKGLEGLKKP